MLARPSHRRLLAATVLALLVAGGTAARRASGGDDDDLRASFVADHLGDDLVADALGAATACLDSAPSGS
jgi:hypothetical protein